MGTITNAIIEIIDTAVDAGVEIVDTAADEILGGGSKSDSNDKK